MLVRGPGVQVLVVIVVVVIVVKGRELGGREELVMRETLP